MAALALDLHCVPSLTDEPRRAMLVLVERMAAEDALVEVEGEPANDGQYPARPAYHYDPPSREIRYEEYHPYGTSAYRAVDSSVDVSARRYRYTGMERDEETGLGYHSARYYAPWLGRWTAADPIGLGDGVNRYAYAGGTPSFSLDRNGQSVTYTKNDPSVVEGIATQVSESVEPETLARMAKLVGFAFSGKVRFSRGDRNSTAPGGALRPSLMPVMEGARLVGALDGPISVTFMSDIDAATFAHELTHAVTVDLLASASKKQIAGGFQRFGERPQLTFDERLAVIAEQDAIAHYTGTKTAEGNTVRWGALSENVKYIDAGRAFLEASAAYAESLVTADDLMRRNMQLAAEAIAEGNFESAELSLNLIDEQMRGVISGPQGYIGQDDTLTVEPPESLKVFVEQAVFGGKLSRETLGELNAQIEPLRRKLEAGRASQ